MKNERQARILEIIAKQDVRTQDEITAALRAEGFKVTQATVSRDLRDLKLAKVTSKEGTYKYAVSHAHSHIGTVKLNKALLEAIVDVRYSLNNVVIKTLPGLAQAVASGVDALQIESILGSVAGDDTIIIVTDEAQSSAEIGDKLRELMSVG